MLTAEDGVLTEPCAGPAHRGAGEAGTWQLTCRGGCDGMASAGDGANM